MSNINPTEANHEQISKDLRMSSNVISGKEYRDIIYAIANTATDVVKQTLGPFGKTSILDDGSFAYPTKDGWNVLKHLRFNDTVFNTLFGIIKQISFNLVSKVGDGTTSALIVATNVLNSLLSFQTRYPEYTQKQIVDTLHLIEKDIIKRLETSEELRQIDKHGDFSDIRRIAHIATNGNEVISDYVQEIYQKTNNPDIFVDVSNDNRVVMEIEHGFKLDAKPIMLKNYINTTSGVYHHTTSDTYIAVFDHPINYSEHGVFIDGLLKYCTQKNLFLVLMAPTFDNVFSKSLGISIDQAFQQGSVPMVMMVQSHMVNTIQKNALTDFLMLINAQVIDFGKVKAGRRLLTPDLYQQNDKEDQFDVMFGSEVYKFDSVEQLYELCRGRSNDLTIGESFVLLQDYEGIVPEELLKNTLAEAEKAYKLARDAADKSSTDLTNDYMNAHQRWIKLIGRMGIIHVGAVSDIEKIYLKDVVDDAVLACKSAYRNGYIRGLNLTTISELTKYQKHISSISDINNEGKLHYLLVSIMMAAFTAIIETVYDNGFNAPTLGGLTVTTGATSEVVDKSFFEVLTMCIDEGYVIDFAKWAMFKDDQITVINSVSTDIEIIKAVISILATTLTSSQYVASSGTMWFDRKQRSGNNI